MIAVLDGVCNVSAGLGLVSIPSPADTFVLLAGKAVAQAVFSLKPIHHRLTLCLYTLFMAAVEGRRDVQFGPFALCLSVGAAPLNQKLYSHRA